MVQLVIAELPNRDLFTLQNDGSLPALPSPTNSEFFRSLKSGEYDDFPLQDAEEYLQPGSRIPGELRHYCKIPMHRLVDMLWNWKPLGWLKTASLILLYISMFANFRHMPPITNRFIIFTNLYKGDCLSACPSVFAINSSILGSLTTHVWSSVKMVITRATYTDGFLSLRANISVTVQRAN